MSSREGKIYATSDVSVIDIFPKLSALDAFKDERPDAIDRQKLTKVIPSLRRENELTIVQFLDTEPTAEFITWEYDVTTGKVLHFGYFYQKIFRGVGKILYSFHKNGEFSGNVIGRMRVSQNLKVNHPFHGVKSSSDFSAGKKADIRHFRWLLARVVKKCFPANYEERLSCYFKTIFSEVFLHQEVLKHNYMFQYFNPVLFNKKHKFQFIHALENIAARKPHSYYVKNTGLNKENYGFEKWWLRIKDDNEETDETMMGAVYYYERKQDKVYEDRPNSLLSFLRNFQEHFMSGLQTKNKRISNKNEENSNENVRRKLFNIRLERQKMGHGSYSRLQNEGKMLPYLVDNARLFKLPSYDEMEERISQKFPGIYSSLMDTYIRYFTGKEMAEFGCTLDQVLQEEGPFAGKMYRVYVEAS